MRSFGKNIAALVAISTLALGACGKGEDKAADKGKEGTSSGKSVAAAPAALKAAVIASMAVEIDVPEDALVDDNSATAHFPSATLYANPTIFLTGKNDMFWKNDLAAQKADIEKSPGNKFKSFTKEEVTEGGFHLEFESTSMMEEPLYSFHVRTTINGTEVDCSSNTQSPEEMARGVKMCQSLRASK